MEPLRKQIVQILSEYSECPAEDLTDEVFVTNQLDSLDLLDAVFALDKALGIKIPLERWTRDVNESRYPYEYYFRLDNFVLRIRELLPVSA